MAYFRTNVLDNQIKALPTIATASGSIATFTTDKAEKLVDCVCEVASGKSEVNVSISDKYIRVTPTTPNTYTQNGITVKTYFNGRIEINGTATANAYIEIDCFDFTIFTDNSRTVRFNNDCVGLTVYFYDGASSFDSWYLSTTNRIQTNFSAMAGKHTTSIRIGINSGVTITNGTLMIEFLVLDDTTTYNIQLGETLSGNGSFNVLSGILTRSDDTTKQLSANYIQTLNGINNLWADTGDTSVKFILSVGEYVNQNV